MAFSSTIVQRPFVVGAGKRWSWGTWDGGGDNGGNIDTGLHKCETIHLTPLTTASANAPAVDETLPCDGNAVTIANGADIDGIWFAIGV